MAVHQREAENTRNLQVTLKIFSVLIPPLKLLVV
jgi:hypothetical protein